MEILRQISVDVAQVNRFQAIVAKQYDKNSRFLKVQLTNLENNIQVNSDCSVVINARREDGVAQAFSGEVNEDGTVTVPITEWMLALDGTVKCDISIMNGTEQVLTTTLFELDVQEAALDEESISGDEHYNVLVELIEEVQEVKDDLDEALEEVQTAIAAAQLVTSPFYIVDNDTGKTYNCAIQVTNGKPVVIYDEFEEE